MEASAVTVEFGLDFGKGHCMRTVLLAPIVALLLVGATPASADFDPVDCSSTPFAFSGEGYLVDCEQSDDSIRVETQNAGVTLDVMSISSEKRDIFFTMVSRRLNGTHVYMEPRPLSDNYREMFNEEGTKDWKGVGRKAGYDVAEFTADISGHISHCIAVQRYTNASYMGYKRHVIGMGCAMGDTASVYDILAKIEAPGD